MRGNIEKVKFHLLKAWSTIYNDAQDSEDIAILESIRTVINSIDEYIKNENNAIEWGETQEEYELRRKNHDI